MTTKEKIEVMQAFLDGKTVLFRKKDRKEWYSMNHYEEPTFDPCWNFDKNDYKIETKPKYRPYKSAKEFLQASKEHGPIICYEDTIYKQFIQIDDRLDCQIIFSWSLDNTLTDRISYSDLLKFYKWQDGTPCGIEEE